MYYIVNAKHYSTEVQGWSDITLNTASSPSADRSCPSVPARLCGERTREKTEGL
jgi:hypothetical protein